MILITNIYSEMLKCSKNGEKLYSFGPINRDYNDLFSTSYVPKIMLIDSFCCLLYPHNEIMRFYYVKCEK